MNFQDSGCHLMVETQKGWGYWKVSMGRHPWKHVVKSPLVFHHTISPQIFVI